MRAGDTMVRERAYQDSPGTKGGRLGSIASAVRGIRDTIDDTGDNIIKQVNKLKDNHTAVEYDQSNFLSI